MDLIKYLKRPYPLTLNRWKISITISIFISFFVVTFQPFGLQYFQSDLKTIILAGYGFVTLLILMINLILLPFIFPKILNEDTWTIFKQISWLCWIVFSISTANYLYSFLFSVFPWIGLKGFLIFTGFTFSIAIIPIAGITVTSYNRLLRKNLDYSRQINEQINKRTIKEISEKEFFIYSENKNQTITTSISNLICIESTGNYVTIWYLKNGLLHHSLLRNTLKNIEIQLQALDSVYKIHRAFIINLSHIEKVKGNSQRYRLKLKYMDTEIPVARNYTKHFKRIISNFI